MTMAKVLYPPNPPILPVTDIRLSWQYEGHWDSFKMVVSPDEKYIYIAGRTKSATVMGITNPNTLTVYTIYYTKLKRTGLSKTPIIEWCKFLDSYTYGDWLLYDIGVNDTNLILGCTPLSHEGEHADFRVIKIDLINGNNLGMTAYGVVYCNSTIYARSINLYVTNEYTYMATFIYWDSFGTGYTDTNLLRILGSTPDIGLSLAAGNAGVYHFRTSGINEHGGYIYVSGVQYVGGQFPRVDKVDISTMTLTSTSMDTTSEWMVPAVIDSSGKIIHADMDTTIAKYVIRKQDPNDMTIAPDWETTFTDPYATDAWGASLSCLALKNNTVISTGYLRRAYGINYALLETLTANNGVPNYIKSYGYSIVPSELPGRLWTEVTASGGYGSRQEFQMVVFKNKMVILGGYTGDRIATVYSSTTGLYPWTREADLPVGSIGFGACVFIDPADNIEKLVVAGGYEDLGLKYTTDLLTWHSLTPPAYGSDPEYLQLLFFNNKLWCIGKCNGNSIFSSTFGGAWTTETTSPEFPASYYIKACVYDNKIWVFLLDRTCWNSSDGVHYTRVSDQPIALYIGALFVYDNKLYGIYGKTICYTTDGTSWTIVTSTADFSSRYWLGACVYNNEFYVATGKLHTPDDVWKSSSIYISTGLGFDNIKYIKNNALLGFSTGGSFVDTLSADGHDAGLIEFVPANGITAEDVKAGVIITTIIP